ncbi:HET-domain-containing protein, partial [Patellaria atrata CBS 101060]
MTTKPYPYRRLPTATSIRLLSLYTYKENSPNGICSLDIVDMNENPQFDALSYTWGDPVPEKLRFDIAAQRDYNANQFLGNTPVTGFLCDGVLLKLEPNLHDALIALLMQNSARNIPRQRYWIDALCINQADMEEKSHQIALMGRIYSVAESVIVWLGLQDESGVDALKLIVQLSEFPSDSWESIRKTSVNVKEPSGH